MLSLYELNLLIRSTFETAFPDTFLVTAEIARVDVKRHCYMELVDKVDDTIRAEMKAVIWADRYETISNSFRRVTGIELSKGIKILFEAYINFHERYGLKLNIIDIDPSYTIGELAIKRREILERLEREGLKDKNKAIEFPLVPQRIGIISSPTAAGYEDMMAHLVNNPYGYRFTCRLYEAIMQGNEAESSIISAIRRCYEDSQYLDVVVMVRGGGSQMDLHCFDSYEIGRMVATLPIPFISGIGHERDITVVDEVANIRAKTPTAVADILITRIKGFEDSIDALSNRLFHGANRMLSDKRIELTSLIRWLDTSVKMELIISEQRLYAFIKGLGFSIRLLQTKRNHLIQEATKLRILSFSSLRGEDRNLNDILIQIRSGIQRRLEVEEKKIEAREDNINHLDPRNILKRGYSITRKDGRAIRSIYQVSLNDKIETIVYDGRIESIVKMKGDGDGKTAEL
ncbi:MAG: exodeoxyribonuclease VII large subunit [Thermodesulfovibrionia bacterium]